MITLLFSKAKCLSRYGQYDTICTRHFEHNNSCIWCGWFIACDYVVVLLWFDCISIQLSNYYLRHVIIISVFSLCLVQGTHQEHVQLVEVDAPEVAQVDGTLSMLNMSRIHNSKSVRGRSLILKGCISSDKSDTASWTAPFWSTIPTSGCVPSKPMHLVRTMQNGATKLP